MSKTSSCCRLTAREEEIIRLAAKGYSNAQIAFQLKISSKTVATYLSRIYMKFGVGNRTEAVVVYLRRKRELL